LFVVGYLLFVFVRM